MTNYDQLWTILDTYAFEFDFKISTYVTCVICRNLLIDACCGQCGCTYCKKCILQYLENEEKLCPGDGDDCKLVDLSVPNSIKTDISACKRVSNLYVNCPLHSCNYNCKLIDMNDHLRVCDQRLIRCPYSEMGCTVVTQDNDRITYHLQSGIYQHNKLMTDWIFNVRNEILNTSQMKFEKSSPKQLNKVNIIANLEWEIGEIKSLRDNKVIIPSKYFYSKDHEYKIWLNFKSNGYRYIKKHTHIVIMVNVSDGSATIQAKWPFQCTITMSISNTTHQNVKQTLIKYCEFDKGPTEIQSKKDLFFHFNSNELDEMLEDNSVNIDCTFEDIN